MAWLVAHLDARQSHLGQKARHYRHGADRPRRGTPGQGFRAFDQLPQTGAAFRARWRKKLSATYWESLDQMLANMDIISVNCPHTPATFHLLSSRRLKLMKPAAYIVNTARGEVIDENALARMVEAGEIAGAGLDVFENEPAINPKLIKNPRVVLLPHLGSATIEGRLDMGEKVIINIRTFLDGHNPPDRVHAAMF